MPYIDNPGDIFKATMAFVYPNEQVQEAGVQFAIGPCGGQDSRLTFAGVIDSLVVAHLVAYLSQSVTYYGCRISSSRGRMPWSSVVTKVNMAGTDITATLPTQARVTTKWQTDYVGVAYRGRTYWPTPAYSTQSISGHPKPDYPAAINVVASTLVGGLTALGTKWTPVVHHKVPRGDIPVLSHTIIGSITPQMWSTQRRSGDLSVKQGLPW